MSSKPNYVCQVCGCEEDPEIAALLAAQARQWVVHRIERRGGIIQVLACPDCVHLTQDLILQSYTERIRLGLVPGFH